MKQLEDRNSKLKRLVATLTLDRSMLQDVADLTGWLLAGLIERTSWDRGS